MEKATFQMYPLTLATVNNMPCNMPANEILPESTRTMKKQCRRLKVRKAALIGLTVLVHVHCSSIVSGLGHVYRMPDITAELLGVTSFIKLHEPVRISFCEKITGQIIDR